MAFINWIGKLNSTSFVQFVTSKLLEGHVTNTTGTGSVAFNHSINGIINTWFSTLDNYLFSPTDGHIGSTSTGRRRKVAIQEIHSGYGFVAFSHKVNGKLKQIFAGKASLSSDIFISSTSEQSYQCSGFAFTDINVMSTAEESISGSATIMQEHSINSSGAQDTTYLEALLYLDEDLYLSKYC